MLKKWDIPSQKGHIIYKKWLLLSKIGRYDVYKFDDILKDIMFSCVGKFYDMSLSEPSSSLLDDPKQFHYHEQLAKPELNILEPDFLETISHQNGLGKNQRMKLVGVKCAMLFLSKVS